MKQVTFFSPTKGKLGWDEVVANILEYMATDSRLAYKLIVGTDSHVKDETCFVTAIIIHRVGKGARYFYRRKWQRKIKSLRQKIFYETALSLEVAGQLANYLHEAGLDDMNLEIHLDVGPNGETKELIREVVGMVVGSGFGAKIKPESCGASTVADKYTK